MAGYPDFNTVILQGNIARDWTVTATSKGGKMAKSALAANKPMGGETHFIPLTVFDNAGNNNLASILEDGRFKKGDRVIVQGALQVDQNGDKYFTFVLVSSIKYCGGGAKRAADGDVTEADALPELGVEEEIFEPEPTPAPAPRTRAAAPVVPPAGRPVAQAARRTPAPAASSSNPF